MRSRVNFLGNKPVWNENHDYLTLTCPTCDYEIVMYTTRDKGDNMPRALRQIDESMQLHKRIEHEEFNYSAHELRQMIKLFDKYDAPRGPREVPAQ